MFPRPVPGSAHPNLAYFKANSLCSTLILAGVQEQLPPTLLGATEVLLEAGWVEVTVRVQRHPQKCRVWGSKLQNSPQRDIPWPLCPGATSWEPQHSSWALLWLSGGAAPLQTWQNTARATQGTANNTGCSVPSVWGRISRERHPCVLGIRGFGGKQIYSRRTTPGSCKKRRRTV